MELEAEHEKPSWIAYFIAFSVALIIFKMFYVLIFFVVALNEKIEIPDPVLILLILSILMSAFFAAKAMYKFVFNRLKDEFRDSQ